MCFNCHELPNFRRITKEKSSNYSTAPSFNNSAHDILQEKVFDATMDTSNKKISKNDHVSYCSPVKPSFLEDQIHLSLHHRRHMFTEDVANYRTTQKNFPKCAPAKTSLGTLSSVNSEKLEEKFSFTNNQHLSTANKVSHYSDMDMMDGNLLSGSQRNLFNQDDEISENCEEDMVEVSFGFIPSNIFKQMH